MTGIQWGRLQADVDCALRRGAWYRVMAIGGLEVTVEVGDRLQSVPRSLLQIVSAPPRRWTVVPRPAGAVGMPQEWTRYAVCPSCRERRALPERGRPRSLTCGRCRGAFEIDWSEGYLAR
jgi:hypothetical protein